MNNRMSTCDTASGSNDNGQNRGLRINTVDGTQRRLPFNICVLRDTRDGAMIFAKLFGFFLVIVISSLPWTIGQDFFCIPVNLFAVFSMVIDHQLVQLALRLLKLVLMMILFKFALLNKTLCNVCSSLECFL